MLRRPRGFGIVLRLVRVCVLLSCLCAAAAAQGRSDTRQELWPEVDLFVRLDERWRLLFLANVNTERETRNRLEGQLGAHVDYAPKKYLSFRAGYRYGFSLADSDDPFREHRILFEQTVRLPLPARVVLSDRNREDLRFVNGEFSARYRNRLTVEREFSVRGYEFTPDASGELYYDSRFDGWNRHRYAFGVVLPAGKRASFDLGYTRQNDSRSQPSHVNALSLTLTLDY